MGIQAFCPQLAVESEEGSENSPGDCFPDDWPVLEAAEHDLDPVAPFVAASIVADLLLAVLSPRNADPYPFVFQRFSISVFIITPVCQEPFGPRQTFHKGRRAHVVADLACRHEELQRPPFGIRHGVKFGIQPAFRAPDHPPHPAGLRGCTAATVPPHIPFFTARLEAVRWAFR